MKPTTIDGMYFSTLTMKEYHIRAFKKALYGKIEDMTPIMRKLTLWSLYAAVVLPLLGSANIA